MIFTARQGPSQRLASAAVVSALVLACTLSASAVADGDGLVTRYYQGSQVIDGRISFANLNQAFCQIDADVQHWNGSQFFRWEPVGGWSNNYSVEWSGFIRIDTAGAYGFGTMSDDGSEVWINNELVVANEESQWYDWEDNLTEGDLDDPMPVVDLAPGFHALTIRFWEGASFDGIEFWWLHPDAGESVIPYTGTNFHDIPPVFDPATNWTRVLAEVLYTRPDTCPGDTNGNSEVAVDDLLDLLASYGGCNGCPTCLGDINVDGQVDVTDLLALLSAWGPCP